MKAFNVLDKLSKFYAPIMYCAVAVFIYTEYSDFKSDIKYIRDHVRYI